MEFQVLYQRNTNGSVQTWKIFVEGSCFWTETSKLNGKTTVSEKTTAKPKNVGRTNSTTGEEQAILEVKPNIRRN